MSQGQVLGLHSLRLFRSLRARPCSAVSIQRSLPERIPALSRLTTFLKIGFANSLLECEFNPNVFEFSQEPLPGFLHPCKNPPLITCHTDVAGVLHGDVSLCALLLIRLSVCVSTSLLSQASCDLTVPVRTVRLPLL